VISGVKVPVLTIRDFDSALSITRDAITVTLQGELSRSNGDLNIDIGSTRGISVVHIQGFKKVRRSFWSSLPKKELRAEGHAPYDVEGLYLAISDYPNRGRMIEIESKYGKALHPIEGDRLRGNMFIPGYRYAVTTKFGKEFSILSILIIDLLKLEVSAEVPCSDLVSGQVSYKIDPKSDSIIVIERQLKWMVVVDLGKLDTSFPDPPKEKTEEDASNVSHSR